MSRRREVFLSLVIVASVVGCGGSESQKNLADSLLTAKDLVGEWSVNLGSADMQLPESGVITEEERKFLPSMDLCPEASQESRAALNSLKWEAFRQFDLTVDDPVDVPTDREGHLVFAQEFLMSGKPEELTGLVDRLSAGLDACVGDVPAGEEGPGTLERFDPAQAGDESIGALYTIGEAGGEGTWYVYVVFVRAGSVLVSVTVADVVLGDLDPLIDVSSVDSIVEAALAKVA